MRRSVTFPRSGLANWRFAAKPTRWTDWLTSSSAFLRILRRFVFARSLSLSGRSFPVNFLDSTPGERADSRSGDDSPGGRLSSGGRGAGPGDRSRYAQKRLLPEPVVRELAGGDARPIFCDFIRQPGLVSD